MELCVLSKIVILLGVISFSLLDCIDGIHSVTVLLLEILTMAFLVIITHLYCDHWVAKAIVIYALFGTIIYVYLCFTNQKITD